MLRHERKDELIILTIKDYNEENRPYEKCISKGPEALSNAELLAIIIRCGTRNKTSVELSQDILDISTKYIGCQDGILGLIHLSIEELTRVRGIGMVKAVQIKCVAELSRRIHKADFGKSPEFTSPDIIAGYYMEDLRHFEEEHLHLLMLNTKHMMLGDHELSKGTVNASLFSPREALREALKTGAVYLVLIHNHPSGDPTPSREDILTTKRMVEAGKITGIPVIDHIIIGDNKFISLKQSGIIKD